MEAKSYFEGPEHQVWVRVAEHNGNIYLDLGNPAWDAVEITPQGWQMVAEPPVYFRRSGSMKALPYPKPGGSLEKLRPFLNVLSKNPEDATSDAIFILLVAWMLAALRPYGPYPIGVLGGEQGTAKSTTARIAASNVDPNTSQLRSAHRDEQSLAIYAHNTWVLGFDNLSTIKPWLSDAFCRLSTGGGISNRELYTNREENILDAMRPIIMNGIDSLTERPDMADRAIILNLEQIPDEKRKPEKEFWEEYEQAKPEILGALLNAVSAGLKNLPNVKLDSLPRMADFAKWIVACEPALPWEKGSFLEAYTGNRADAVELSLEADVVAVALRAHMANLEQWEGTPKELHVALEDYISETTKKSKAWPKAPNWLSNRLLRAATFLRKVGIDIDFSKSGDRKITIERLSTESKQNSVHSVQTPETKGFEPDADSAQMDVKEKIASTGKQSKHLVMDAKDTKDAKLHTPGRDGKVCCRDCDKAEVGNGYALCQGNPWNGIPGQVPDKLHPCQDFIPGKDTYKEKKQ